jgi:hypothetical protein
MSIQSLLASPDPLWTLMDEFLRQLCEEWASQWLELQDARVEVAEQYDITTIELPVIIIVGVERNMSEAEAEFGDGEYHLSGLRYPYEIHIVGSFGVLQDAKKFAAQASASFSDALRRYPTFGGLGAENGEVVELIEFDDGDIYVRGIAGQESGNYTGIAIVRLLVHTEI